MFISTRAVGKKIVGELRFFSALYSFLMQLLYSGFLVFSIITGRGSTAVNGILLVITLAFTVFLLSTLIAGKFLSRGTEKGLKHICRIAMLVFKGIALYITVYGIYTALGDINPTAIILAAFMLVAWVLGILFEVVRFIFERYTSLITSAIIKDTNPMVSFYNKVTFKKNEPHEKTKTDAYVDGIAKEYKKELDEKKASRKARKEAEKIIRKEKRRKALRSFASGTKNKISSFFHNSDGNSEEKTDKSEENK